MHQFRIARKTIESAPHVLVGQIALVGGQGRPGCNTKVSCLRSSHAPGLKDVEGLLLFMLIQVERCKGDIDVSIGWIFASRVRKNRISKLWIRFECEFGTAHAPG